MKKKYILELFAGTLITMPIIAISAGCKTEAKVDLKAEVNKITKVDAIASYDKANTFATDFNEKDIEVTHSDFAKDVEIKKEIIGGTNKTVTALITLSYKKQKETKEFVISGFKEAIDLNIEMAKVKKTISRS